MTLEERAQIDDLAEWLDNNADGAEDAGALAHNCTRWFPALVSLREQLAHGCLDEMHLVAVTNLPIVEAERDALREQVAEREEAAFMAGWIEGNSEVVHGLTWTYSQESQQRDAAFLRWQARQKGTPT